MKVMLFGPTGHLGEALMAALPRHGHTVIPIARSDVDITNLTAIIKTIETLAPEVVINAAALCGMEACAVAPDLALGVNAIAPGVMATAARKAGAIFIHFSTDFVFSGKEGGLTEGDAPDPCGVYGVTKLAGEESVARSGGHWFIFRISSIYGLRLSGALGVLQQANEGKGTEDDPIRVLHQYCAPTSVQLIATQIAKIIKPGIVSSSGAIYHLAVRDGVWKLDFARSLLARLGHHRRRYGDLIVQEGSLALDRPVHTQLLVDKFERAFGSLPTWRLDLGSAILSSPLLSAA